MLQSNLVKQLAKLVKVRYVEDITSADRVGELFGHDCVANHSAAISLGITENCLIYALCCPSCLVQSSKSPGFQVPLNTSLCL